MTYNILIISSEFNYSCGVSKHVYLLTKYWKIYYPENNIFFITNGGDGLARLDELNINYKIVNFKRGSKNLLLFFNFVISLFIFCIKNKITVIHTHHRLPELVSVILSKILKIKTVTTVHSFVKRYNHFSFKSDKVIAVNNSIRDYLVSVYNVKIEMIDVLYHFIERFNAVEQSSVSLIKKNYNIKEDDFIITCIGRIGFQKGTDILIKAFKLLIEENKTVKLLLAGIIDDEDIIPLIQNDDRIIYMGIVKDVENYYFLSSVIVMPSREETFGYTMLEAGMMNKPFVGCKTGGIAEFIEDGVNGLLVEPANVDDLYMKLRFVLNNPEKAKEMGEKLFIKVNKFLPSAKEYISRLKTIYENL